MTLENYVIRVLAHPGEVAASDWDALLDFEPDASPFVRHAYLRAMHESGSAVDDTGWTPRFITIWLGDQLHAACPLYLKHHSYGEYVFDWAWAQAYQQHGLPYYPKGLVAVPFTPVPGARLLARSAAARNALVQALIEHASTEALSSLHLLFLREQDQQACLAAGMMLRHTVQFHWTNEVPLPATCLDTPDEVPGAAADHAPPFQDFEHFLASLQQDKRKKIRQERRKVTEAGVQFRWAQGTGITAEDWTFFYRCYQQTYLEHGNAPYLTPTFFEAMARDMPDHWLLFVAERDGRPIACSLIAIDPAARVAYGRYWGALERVDCLHFEACYYQPLAWCIERGYRRFEGGAQGEHKMARALLPTSTTSAHWLAHPAFADAVERFLLREGQGIHQYLDHLAERTPLKK